MEYIINDIDIRYDFLVVDKKLYTIGNLDGTNYTQDELNGRGKIISSSGIIYEGQFIDGELNGKGKITYDDGTIYEGEFRVDSLNGEGKQNIRI